MHRPNLWFPNAILLAVHGGRRARVLQRGPTAPSLGVSNVVPRYPSEWAKSKTTLRFRNFSGTRKRKYNVNPLAEFHQTESSTTSFISITTTIFLTSTATIKVCHSHFLYVRSQKQPRICILQAIWSQTTHFSCY
ncbi:hypothetical protein F5X99DRAFT_266190 [Biscogniauxia marginata]|nr:hypothetical protein F5X99DRAFT_266190 [Biscogniauxia marginata]